MSLKSAWAKHQQKSAVRRELRDLNAYAREWGADALRGSRSAQSLQQVSQRMERLAANSHGRTRKEAEGMARATAQMSREAAHDKAREAARKDHRDMAKQERQIAEGKLPVEKVGKAFVKDGQLHMSGWQFEGHDGQGREIPEGADIKEATGWSAQQLYDMSQRAAQDRIYEQSREQLFGESQGDREAGE